MAKSPAQISESTSSSEPIVTKSAAEVYVQRHMWELPSEHALLQNHPLTRAPWWKEILATTQTPVSDRDSFDAHRNEVKRAWQSYLLLLSWWQSKRFFRRSGMSIVCLNRADVVVVHPVGRFTVAKSAEQWKDACYWSLLAYCNHGSLCSATFTDVQHLDTMPEGEIEQLMQKFVMALAVERAELGITACPPHVRKNWLLGCSRREHAESRKQSVSKVTESLWKIPRFVFETEGESWKHLSTTDMSSDDLAVAQSAWKNADAFEFKEDDSTLDEEQAELGIVAGDRICHPNKHDSDQHMDSNNSSNHPEEPATHKPSTDVGSDDALCDLDATCTDRPSLLKNCDSNLHPLALDRLCHPTEAAAGDRTVSTTDAGSANAKEQISAGKIALLSVAVRQKMDQHMRSRLKWTHRDLHDAVIAAGLNIPGRPSLLNYFRALNAQFGDSKVGFLPQAFQSHSKKKIQSMLKCLSRTGAKISGNLSDRKTVLAERLAFWLNQVMEAGREARCEDVNGEELSDPSDGEPCVRKKIQNRYILPDTRQIGEVPSDAVVTPEQAESALGHAQATEFDEDRMELLDQELRQEEEALLGRQVNPSGIDYRLVVCDPTQEESRQRIGWGDAFGVPRVLNLGEFSFSKIQIVNQ